MDANLPIHYRQSVALNATPERVFEHLDDFETLGEHMMHSSWMMAGSRMRFEFDEARGRKVGAYIRLIGSMLGMKLEIEERVTERTPPVSKAWQTMGRTRMIIIEGYRMGFTLSRRDRECLLTVFIDYAVPHAGFGRWLGNVAAAPYARWCVESMVAAAAQHFGRSKGTSPSSQVSGAAAPR